MSAPAVEGLRWYHTLELPGGVVTPGAFDVRPAVPRVPLPADLRGRRCLDVGTWDGFWAFELERRGAAEVVAIDLEDPRDWDWPAGADRGGVDFVRDFKAGDSGFAIARAALGSSVERRDVSVYDLDPAVHGTFDLVLMGDLLLHLRDPARALERLAGVVRPGGSVVLFEMVDALATLTHPRTPLARLDTEPRGTWWIPNRAALLGLAASAGLVVEHATGVFSIPLGPAHPPPAWRTCSPATRSGRGNLLLRGWGVPHVALRARPAA